MLGNFDNLPSIDHLIEGVHYKLVEWDYADPAVPHTPGTPCPDGYKMVFGLCRKLKAGSQDWDREQESEEEKAASKAAKEKGSSYERNIKVEAGGKKYGWARLGGKPVIVEWGSVAGVRNPDGSITKTTRNPDGSTSTSTTPSPTTSSPPAPTRPSTGQPVRA